MKDEDVDIVKMDATANDVPPPYHVRGFPTLYWKPKSGSPVPYDVSRNDCFFHSLSIPPSQLGSVRINARKE